MLSNSFLWMFLLPLITVLVPVWLGQRYGSYSKKHSTGIVDGPIASAVGASLALLAFMLGIVFQFVGNRFDKRQALMTDEFSSLRNTYLYAALVPEPIRSNTRRLVVSYVDTRMELRQNRIDTGEAKLKEERILDTLWTYAEALAAQDRSSEVYSLYTATVANVINVFKQRIIIIYQTRLPLSIYYVLGLVAFLSMLMLGYQFGTSGKITFALSIMLGMAFASVMWLIFAFDRPETGFIIDSDRMLKNFHHELHGVPGR